MSNDNPSDLAPQRPADAAPPRQGPDSTDQTDTAELNESDETKDKDRFDELKLSPDQRLRHQLVGVSPEFRRVMPAGN